MRTCQLWFTVVWVWVRDSDSQRVLPKVGHFAGIAKHHRFSLVCPLPPSMLLPLSVILRAGIEFVVAWMFFGKTSFYLQLEEFRCFQEEEYC